LAVQPGDRVAIVWPTSVEFVVAYLGVLAAGAVAVPLNPHSPSNELARELGVIEPAAVLAGETPGLGGSGPSGPSVVSAVLHAVASRAVECRVVVPSAAASGTDPSGPSVVAWEEVAPLRPGADTGSSDGLLTAMDRSDDDLAVLVFTSGTAGPPRAAMLTHGNLTANLRQMLGVPDIVRTDDVALVALPLFHIFGLNVALGLALATGAALVLDERFDAGRTIEQVRELGVTTLLGVPAMYSAWADASSPAGGDASAMSSVRRAISGAAALDPAVADRFEHRYGVAVWQGYGLTEASPGVSTSLGTGRNRAGSVGQPLPGVEVAVVDDAGSPVLEGDPGEIWVRGPNVFAGYWRDSDASRSVLGPDGWLHTGDVGVIGDDGDLFVVDRSKDLIIVSGFNVFPAEVEHVVAEVPGVAEAVAVGRPDTVTGEAVEVVIVLLPGATVTEDQVRAHCLANLARYKCPTTVRFVSALPHGLVGKALRRELRQRFA
jgi:long-chain acyl-CoA synthetase